MWSVSNLSLVQPISWASGWVAPSFSGGGSYTYTAWTEVAAVIPAGLCGVRVHAFGVPGYDSRWIEFAVGTGGTAEATLVKDMPLYIGGEGEYWFTAPAGKQLLARVCGPGSGDFPFSMQLLLGGGLTPVSPILRESLNADRSNARGSTQVDAGGTANTWGSWTQLVASTSVAYKGLQVRHFTPGSFDNGAAILQVGIGASSSEVSILEVRSCSRAPNRVAEVYLNIPVGTRIAARHQCNVTDNPGTRHAYPLIVGIR
jgi:hypothetical protein